MARDHARMQCALWRTDDWKALTLDAQHAYQMLVQQELLSYCGVMPYVPSELAKLSAGNTEARIKRAVKALQANRWVIVDPRTHELLVRSYVRHDGVLDRVNMGKATAAALRRVISLDLRIAVMGELRRYWHQEPGLAGWIGFKETSPTEFAVITGMASGME